MNTANFKIFHFNGHIGSERDNYIFIYTVRRVCLKANKYIRMLSQVKLKCGKRKKVMNQVEKYYPAQKISPEGYDQSSFEAENGENILSNLIRSGGIKPAPDVVLCLLCLIFRGCHGKEIFLFLIGYPLPCLGYKAEVLRTFLTYLRQLVLYTGPRQGEKRYLLSDFGHVFRR